MQFELRRKAAMNQLFPIIIELDVLLFVCGMPSVTEWILDKIGV